MQAFQHLDYIHDLKILSDRGILLVCGLLHWFIRRVALGFALVRRKK